MKEGEREMGGMRKERGFGVGGVEGTGGRRFVWEVTAAKSEGGEEERKGKKMRQPGREKKIRGRETCRAGGERGAATN